MLPLLIVIADKPNKARYDNKVAEANNQLGVLSSFIALFS